MTHYIHVGLWRMAKMNKWNPCAEIYDDERAAQADLRNVENYSYTLVIPSDGHPRKEDWTPILGEQEANARLERQYERGLRAGAGR